MTEKTLVPIFVFWALLTIITPTLILLSEKSKADLDFNGNRTEVTKVRRMIGYTENHDQSRRTAAAAEATAKLVVADEEELASAPAPPPVPLRAHSHHNHTKSNSTDGNGLELLPSKVRIQIKQANIR